MKNQYFADERDYLKYSIIRYMTAQGLTCTVCWMMTPNDESGQGDKKGYLEEPGKWAHCDPAVFAYLRDQYVTKSRRECKVMEEDGPIASCRFFVETVPESRDQRPGFISRCLEAAVGTQLLFFDPDIGVYRKGVRSWEENQYLFWEELKRVFEAGHTVMVYQHLFPRGQDSFMERRTQLFKTQLQIEHVSAIRAKEVAFFFASQTDHLAILGNAQAAIEQAWYPKAWRYPR